ncbi:MAG: hypothetical protein AAFO79_00265 [Pseudomonadota bacterium]
MTGDAVTMGIAEAARTPRRTQDRLSGWADKARTLLRPAVRPQTHAQLIASLLWRVPLVAIASMLTLLSMAANYDTAGALFSSTSAQALPDVEVGQLIAWAAVSLDVWNFFALTVLAAVAWPLRWMLIPVTIATMVLSAATLASFLNRHGGQTELSSTHANAQLVDARTRLEFLQRAGWQTDMRAPGEVDADITASLAKVLRNGRTVAQATANCSPDDADTAKFCAEVLELRRERAQIEQATQRQAEIATLRREIRGQTVRLGREADATFFSSVFATKIDGDDLLRGQTVLITLIVTLMIPLLAYAALYGIATPGFADRLAREGRHRESKTVVAPFSSSGPDRLPQIEGAAEDQCLPPDPPAREAPDASAWEASRIPPNHTAQSIADAVHETAREAGGRHNCKVFYQTIYVPQCAALGVRPLTIQHLGRRLGAKGVVRGRDENREHYWDWGPQQVDLPLGDGGHDSGGPRTADVVPIRAA